MRVAHMNVADREREGGEKCRPRLPVSGEGESVGREDRGYPGGGAHDARDAVVEPGPGHRDVEQEIPWLLVAPEELSGSVIGVERYGIDIKRETRIEEAPRVPVSPSENGLRPSDETLLVGADRRVGNAVVEAPESKKGTEDQGEAESDPTPVHGRSSGLLRASMVARNLKPGKGTSASATD